MCLSYAALGGIGCPSKGKCKKPPQEELRTSLYFKDIITSVCMCIYKKDSSSTDVFTVLMRIRENNKH